MIKIESSDLSSIVAKHTEACLGYVLPRLDFYIDFFNSIGNKEYLNVKSLKDRYGINDNSIFTIIDIFLISKKKKRNKKYIVNANEITSLLNSKQCSIIKDSGNLNKFKGLFSFFSLVRNNARKIINGTPAEIDFFINSGKFDKQNDPLYKNVLKKIFSYEQLTGGGFTLKDRSKWNNYSLSRNLDLSVCPYCNRNWINTIENGVYIMEKGGTRSKVTSPQLDHYLAKEDFPLFRLSFYNLIPSCETCNARLKKKIEFKYNVNLHPYEEGYGIDACFYSNPNDYNAIVGIGDNYDLGLSYRKGIDIEKKKKIDNNHKIFEIDSIYAKHKDLITELYRKKYILGADYLDTLNKQFPSLKIGKSELYNMAFGNYYEESDFKKRSFSKLTRDIVEQLNLLKI